MWTTAIFAARILAVAIAGLSIFHTPASATDPDFAVLTTQAGKPPEVQRDGTLRLRFTADLPDNAKLELRLDNIPFSATSTSNKREATFQFSRDKNGAEWNRVLGAASGQRKTVSLIVKLDDKVLNYHAAPFAADESAQAKAEIVPAEPTSFAILQQDKTDPKIQLKKELHVRIDGDTVVDPAKLALRIDGDVLNKKPPRAFENREFVFALERTTDNRTMWARLLGSPFSDDSRSKVVGLDLDGKPLKYRAQLAPDEVKKAELSVTPYETNWMYGGLAALGLILIVSIWSVCCTTLVRDTTPPQMRRSERPFSLGRMQMLFWFYLIVGSFIFIFLMTFDLNSITTESFTLLGISATTALASVAIDRSKIDGAANQPDPEQTRKDIDALGIKSRQDTKRLHRVYKDKNKRSQTVSTLSAELKLDGADTTKTIQTLWDEYEKKIEPFRTRGLLKDLINDISGPTIHRFQIVLWTLVLGAIYGYFVYVALETPSFGANLLTLMGISGATYLGFKIPEKQS